MRIRFVISCLLGISLVFTNTTSSHFELNLSEEVQNPASSIRTDYVSNLDDPGPSNEMLERKPLPDNAGLDEVRKDTKVPTMVERARAALAESNSPAISNHDICTRLVEVARANELPLGFFTN